ncbi:FMN-binding negative transcriptional regulator [Novosphingobium sp. KN65.2]|uniref:FMN-binding negative transcriptional regulator n=1 Tax=Novosphingobium sp. KN65.2 TaxID=1478134 RepID=UPI0005E42E7F|nr:FMN-binding negative transcriptional regulator [Novosphingobium sp. KN65.2]CDO34387.1 putative Transcriptional regulator-like [Novosphingobium sp. KN65.2]
MLNPAFDHYSHEDMRRLIAEYPLAWVLCPGAPAASASLLPMLGTYGEDGALTGLVGHMSRRNPLHALFEREGKAQFLFTGPQGYVSAEHAGRRKWGPTWNYAQARIEADVHIDETLTAQAVARLVSTCEQGREQPWNVAELEERYTGMLGMIIGFEARVTALDATFKLGQDESPDVLEAILASHPDADLREWMEAFNRDRRK